MSHINPEQLFHGFDEFLRCADNLTDPPRGVNLALLTRLRITVPIMCLSP